MKKYSRLVTYGASMVYGAALPDCDVINDPNPETLPASKFAWPAILGENLNVSVANRSGPGHSNQQILLEILNGAHEQNDLVIIYWNNSLVSTVHTESGAFINLYGTGNAGVDNDFFESYFRVHSDFDLLKNTLLQVLHANDHLELQGIKVFNFWIEPYYEKILDENRLLNVFKKNPTPCRRLPFRCIDRGSDGMHPGLLSHRNMAFKIQSIIEESENNHDEKNK